MTTASHLSNHLTVKPIAGALGAEIAGTGPLAEISDAAMAEIRKIWLQYGVIFFRDQPLPPKDFVAFARRFGEVVHYPFLKGLDEAPEVITVAKLEHEKVNFGGLWHTDTAYLEIPPHGDHAGRPRSAGLWRRHAVCQRLRGL